MLEIYFLMWDDENEQHFARHSITPREVRQMLSNQHVIGQNVKGGENRILLVGRTNGGRILAVSLESTHDAGTWRPVTGWPAKKNEAKLLSED